MTLMSSINIAVARQATKIVALVRDGVSAASPALRSIIEAVVGAGVGGSVGEDTRS
jgi:hypothetical protein